MTRIIEGYIRDSKDQGIPSVDVEVFQKKLPPFPDLRRSSPPPPDKTDNKGYFKIMLVQDHSPNDSLYLRVTGLQQQGSKFISVIDRQSRYKKGTFFDDVDNPGPRERWIGEVLKNLDDVIYINVTKEPIVIPPKYDSIIIGSGFGGTVSALTIAKKNHGTNKRVCILERGQWWVSHEMPASKEGTTDGKTTIREFLHQKNMPYSTWAYPNDIRGVFTVFGNSRKVNRIKGLYDYRQLKNVHVIAASGVGGGSLVYTNVTEEPDGIAYANWPTQSDGSPGLENYFDRAFRFIGVNPIPTNASVGRFKLPRAKVFHDAAKAISDSKANIINIKKDENGNPILDENNKPLLDLDARLSITEIPETGHIFSNEGPLEFYARVDKGKEVEELTEQEKLETFGIKYSNETNLCQRQGRCVLGCIPGARHTLNKRIHRAIDKDKLPLDVHPLCEVIDIKEVSDADPNYRYEVKFLDYRDIIDDKDYDPTKELKPDVKNRITKTIRTTRVIVAAGSLGSTEILLRCKKNGSLKLSEKLGTGFSTNGDLLGVIIPTKENVDASRGPITTSIARFKDGAGNFAFSIEDEGIPKMFAEVFATIFQSMLATSQQNLNVPLKNMMDHFNNLIKLDINDTKTISDLFRLTEGINLSFLTDLVSKITQLVQLFQKEISSPEEKVSNILMLGGIGRDNPNGNLVLDQNNNLDLKEKYDLEQGIFKQIIDAMKDFAKQVGKDGEKSLLIPFWNIQNNNVNKSQFVLHPIGGCRMAMDSSEGVVNNFGEVFKVENANVGTTNPYQELYVIDGAIIPSSLGVNPSLTITALALRIAEQKLAGGNVNNLPK